MIPLPHSKEDLEALVANQVQESLHLEYKRSDSLGEKQLPELSKSVTSFANADGGTIVFGIYEDRRTPTGLDLGVDPQRVSKERIGAVIRSNVSPSLPGCEIVQIPLSATTVTYAIGVDKSFAGPHQDRKTHRYYKRWNFECVPMEDYEIADIRARRRGVESLVRIDVQIHRATVVYLVVENPGSLAAQDVRFSLPNHIKWRDSSGQPAVFGRGIKNFYPGRHLAFLMNSYPVLVQDATPASLQFEITANYFHPGINAEHSETFHLDLIDYYGSAYIESDAERLRSVLVDAGKNTCGEIRRVSDSLEQFAPLNSGSGLNLSVTTIRNFKRLMAGSESFEKLDPRNVTARAFREVLGVSTALSHAIESRFRWSHGPARLEDIEGMTPAILEAFRASFSLPEDPAD